MCLEGEQEQLFCLLFLLYSAVKGDIYKYWDWGRKMIFLY